MTFVIFTTKSLEPLISLKKLLYVVPSVLQATIDLCQTHATDVNALKVLFSSLILICKLFYSLNFQVNPCFATPYFVITQ